jgi:hypothetical protein
MLVIYQESVPLELITPEETTNAKILRYWW